MKSSKIACAIACGVLLSAAVFTSAPPSAAAEPTGEAKKRLAACDHYMSAYARSSARKLSRALAGQKFEFKKLPAKATFAAGERQFDVLLENDDSAAGLVEKTRAYRTTYVVAYYEHGPLIAQHDWPSREQIASGQKECRPVSSRIAFPQVPVAEVDVEPFKFWGLRVVWHVPTDLPAEVAKTAPFDALESVIASSD